MSRKNKFSPLFICITAITILTSLSHADEICRELRKAWGNVHSYQCTYRAVTFHEGKKSATLMRYSFQKPNKVRMDIEKPSKGAILIYNPDVSEKVKVMPFPKLPFFVLNYGLTDRRVSSDSGGTIDKSDLGNRIESFCRDLEKQRDSPFNVFTVTAPLQEIILSEIQNGKKFSRKFTFGENNLLSKIEVLNEEGEILETFEWNNLNINLSFDPQFFTKF